MQTDNEKPNFHNKKKNHKDVSIYDKNIFAVSN